MDQTTHNKIVSFIWGIADDVLRDLFKRGKYPDVILPMCVIRRMDAVLEPTKRAVLDTKKVLDEARITEQRAALAEAAGQAFYNTSKFTLRDLKSRGSQQQLLADFEDYLNGFSPNVQDILDNFKFRNQLTTLSKADAIGTLINKFLDPDIDLSPAGIDNHSMGTVFEELVRKFNEENNEEAGEHWTPRDAVRLMANLVFLPIEAEIKSGTYLLYDCACGTGGMLTVGEETLTAIGAKRAQQAKCLLYGQEINPETYAVCKADMLLKGEGESADHIVGGAEWSTLSHDAFPAQEFDFMLSNPPYGKSWKKDRESMGGKDGMRDARFKVMQNGEELSFVTRSSDGQMLFLANMASKMNAKSVLGSRIAEVHNGSSLFTGDAGQGESNIRRWIIGVSSQGHINQSVRVRPRLTDSSLVAWEASWSESETMKPSDNMLRKEYAQLTRLQRAVNADVASLHANPVAETVDNARKQQELTETSPMRRLSPAGYQRRHGGKEDVSTGEALGARRRNPAEEATAITASGKCRSRHQGGGSGRTTDDGRAAKRVRREGPEPVSIPFYNVRQG